MIFPWEPWGRWQGCYAVTLMSMAWWFQLRPLTAGLLIGLGTFIAGVVFLPTDSRRWMWGVRVFASVGPAVLAAWWQP